MKQKGIIQIPFLIAIIVVVVMGSVIGAGVILQTQGKLDPLLANVSQIFKGTEKPIAEEFEEIKKRLDNLVNKDAQTPRPAQEILKGLKDKTPKNQKDIVKMLQARSSE